MQRRRHQSAGGVLAGALALTLAFPAQTQGQTPNKATTSALDASAPTVRQHVLVVDEGPHYVVHLREAEDVPPDRVKAHGRHGRPYHPAPGIIVDVVDAQGAVHAAEFQRIARNSGYWPFRRCYEEGLRRDQALAGKVFLQVRVAATGAVERSDLTRWTLRDESVAACVAREARRLPLESADTATDAAITVTLATGDEPVPVARPVPDADRIREELRASWPAVEQCYTDGLARRPDAGGRIELRFRVAPTGEVADVAEGGETHFADVEVARCVLGVYRTASLPALHAESHEHTFVYVLHLESDVTPPAQP